MLRRVEAWNGAGTYTKYWPPCGKCSFFFLLLLQERLPYADVPVRPLDARLRQFSGTFYPQQRRAGRNAAGKVCAVVWICHTSTSYLTLQTKTDLGSSRGGVHTFYIHFTQGVHTQRVCSVCNPHQFRTYAWVPLTRPPAFAPVAHRRKKKQVFETSTATQRSTEGECVFIFVSRRQHVGLVLSVRSTLTADDFPRRVLHRFHSLIFMSVEDLGAEKLPAVPAAAEVKQTIKDKTQLGKPCSVFNNVDAPKTCGGCMCVYFQQQH